MCSPAKVSRADDGPKRFGFASFVAHAEAAIAVKITPKVVPNQFIGEKIAKPLKGKASSRSYAVHSEPANNLWRSDAEIGLRETDGIAKRNAVANGL